MQPAIPAGTVACISILGTARKWYPRSLRPKGSSYGSDFGAAKQTLTTGGLGSGLSQSPARQLLSVSDRPAADRQDWPLPGVAARSSPLFEHRRYFKPEHNYSTFISPNRDLVISLPVTAPCRKSLTYPFGPGIVVGNPFVFRADSRDLS